MPKVGRDKALPKTVHTERLLNPDLKREIRRRATEELAGATAKREDQKISAADTLSRVILRGMPTDDEAHRLLGLLSAASEAMQDENSVMIWSISNKWSKTRCHHPIQLSQ